MKNNRTLVALTGATGNMGKAVVKELMHLTYVNIRILSLDDAKSRKVIKKWEKKYGNRLEVIYGNMKNIDDCRALVEDADYVVNMAAIIPPHADKNPELARDVNVVGVKKLVTAIEEQVNQPKFIHTSTVAIYGNRDYNHPWGRVGDPLLPSAYDTYGTGKLIGERYVLDSTIKEWAVLRQTGILYDKLLMANISDGLMFHTCFNVPIEWVTDTDSGILIKNIIKRDHNGEIKDFWKKVYNIGGGKEYRTTGFETFDMGFGMIGGSAEKFMRPNWQATRNFHCMWFEDSDELENRFHFQNGSMKKFWDDVYDKNRYFGIAKILPPSMITSIAIKPLLKDSNAPYKWVAEGEEGRIKAFFKSKDEWNALDQNWDNYSIWNKNQVKGHNYNKEIDISFAQSCRLSHGFDDTKKDEDIDLADLQSAAAFRGGKCLETTFTKGDVYRKVRWECEDGHVFEASPYTVLRAGHWCPHCIRENRWNFDRLAKKNKFYAQVWYDSHDVKENSVYYIDSFGKSQVREDIAA